MANANDNDLDDLDFSEGGSTSRPPEGRKPGNRNFWIALGILGAIFAVIAAALVFVVLFVLPGRNAALMQQTNAQLAANTATAQFATDDAMKAIMQLTVTATQPATATSEAAATNTPVIAPLSTSTPTATTVSDAQKATLAAQQTQLASGKFTATVIATSTALPDTGFADQVGLPGMFGLALALILVIFVARRLRSTAA
jgi:hypothetical protein